MLQAIIKPVLIGPKSDENASRAAVSSNHDLFIDGESQILREVILHFR